MTATRRHGAALEEALLDAAWDQLVDHGYATFTMDAVAARAGTSRPVLYRRWADKHELVRAAVARAVSRDSVPTPDTGTLRGDTVAMMKLVNKSRLRTATVMLVHLSGYYQETRTTPADLRQTLRGDRPLGFRLILDRAMQRGEIPDRPVDDRTASLPYTLLLQEFLFTLKPVPTAVIEQIVDTIFLPLVS